MRRYLMWHTDNGKEKCKYVLAPDWEEAEKQMYGYMNAENIMGDITDIEGDTYNYERDYIDTETGEVLTEGQVYESYIETYPDREILFTGYLKDCQSKNGFLEYMKGSEREV